MSGERWFGDDQSIGAWVRSARRRLGFTQERLGALMRDRGHAWSQATVWAVERGDRPLRLSEALHVSAITGHPLLGEVLTFDEMGEVPGRSSYARGFRDGVRAAAQAASEVAR